MYHMRTPDPEPFRVLFENALTDLNNPLRKLWFIRSRLAFRTNAYHASLELRRMGRHADADQLDAAREEVLPLPREYGDRPDREGVFAQGKPAKRLPFPKFK